MNKFLPHLMSMAIAVYGSMALANDPKSSSLTPKSADDEQSIDILQRAIENNNARESNHDHEHTELFTDPFFDLLNATYFNEVPQTTKEVVSNSDVIAIVKVVSVRPGRVLDYRQGNSSPLRMAVLKLEVADIIKGKFVENLFMEYLVDGISPESLDVRAYDGEMLVFLRKANSWNPETYTVEFGDRGLENNATLHELTTQRGLMIMHNNGTFQPLEKDEDVRLFPQQNSFDDLIQLIQAYMG